ncbi:hypothetical protein BDZ85DRAFT_46813 [Elsinoe ampelina]|uniref:Azaphilone pigments biosynthesis cluster protein L N-terminal domain-containing protein n=1 Tax=Elsinoe ampelina TaxID=302913 RepID=A0A6A6G169_9PEZI|nr:hypothetical protein BDZ85DRAFT_46813 [Elsinoe ampelina]
MDPLSVTAGIIAIGGFTTASLKVILKVRGASDEIQALINEISDLSAIVKDVEHTLLHNKHLTKETPGFSNLHTVLVRAKTTITHLHAFVNSVLIKEESMLRNERLSRTTWLKQKPQVSKYQHDLLSIRTELSQALGLANLNISARIELSVTQIVALSDATKSLLESRIDDASQLRDDLKSLRQQLVPIKPNGESVKVSPEIVPSSNVLPLHSGNLKSDSDLLFEGHRGLEVSVVWRPRWACDSACLCVCHELVHGRSSKMLDRFLGILFWGYSGLPVMRKRCDVATCRRKRGLRFNMSYYFPGWFVEKRIELTLRSMPLGAPQLSIKMASIVNNGALVFKYVHNRNLTGIQSLFSSGLASPSDAGHLDGCTPLHFAVERGCIDIVDFLLKANADPMALNTHLESPATYAWDIILSNSMPEQITKYFRAVFTDRDFLEEQNFTPVHEIVLGLNGKRLPDALSELPQLTDSPDARGNTPLIWAATRGDAQKLSDLLEHGADPAYRNDNGWNALYAAVNHSKLDCTNLLLSRGFTEYKDGYGMSTLHRACQQTDPTYVKLILKHNPNVDEQDVFQRCPLALAAWRNNAIGAKYLIEKGANKETRDIFGATPLLRAIQYAAVDAARVLLDGGCDVLVVDHEAQNLLHRAALSRDIPTLDFIATNSHHFCGIDTYAKDASGITPKQRLDSVEPSAELLKAFTTMTIALESAKQLVREKQAAISYPTTDADDFKDAKEYISEDSSLSSFPNTDAEDTPAEKPRKQKHKLPKPLSKVRRDWSSKYKKKFRSYEPPIDSAASSPKIKTAPPTSAAKVPG